MIVRSGRLISRLEVNPGDPGVNGASLDAHPLAASLRLRLVGLPVLGGCMRRSWWCLMGLTLAAGSVHAQGLRDRISELFIFTAGKDPLFLGGTAGSDSATALHADHFIPAARSENGTLISFIGNAISGNVANLPVSATSGGSTFRIDSGRPLRTSVSPR